MAMTAVKLKIMPSSPEVNLDEVQEKVKSSLEEKGAKNLSFELEPIAFGLKAIIAKFAWPEESDTSQLENIEVENISSAEIIDYRRAFG